MPGPHQIGELESSGMASAGIHPGVGRCGGGGVGGGVPCPSFPAQVQETLTVDRWLGGVRVFWGCGMPSTADTPRPSVCRTEAHVQGPVLEGPSTSGAMVGIPLQPLSGFWGWLVTFSVPGMWMWHQSLNNSHKASSVPVRPYPNLSFCENTSNTGRRPAPLRGAASELTVSA